MNYVSYLIDLGWDYKDIKLIKKGILRGEELLEGNPRKYDAKNLCKLYYFIGNGYYSIYYIKCYKLGYKSILDNLYLQKAKKCYRNAIANSNDINSVLKKRLWTNYANSLDLIGRSVESLYAYEEVLKIDPNFSMALGNKAIAMKLFADVSGNYREGIYNYSYKILKSIIENKDLIRIGGLEAKHSFEREIRTIEEKIDSKILKKVIKHPPIDLSDKSSFEKFYIQFCLENSLFLNFHIHEGYCEASIADPIFISLLLPSGDNTTFYDLGKHINQIKEDYAVARLLLVQSQFKKNDLSEISKMTTYINTPDYSIFNLYIGLLKSAFKDAYNILDKIACFIDDYFWLGLGINDKLIYFTKKELWKDKIKKDNWKIKLEIQESKNPSLYALYDINLDFDFNSGYYKSLRIMRNKLVHDKLVVHGPEWSGIEDNYNIKFDNMLQKTIELLKIVKSAIIYLINAVQIEEVKKKSNFIIGPPIEVNMDPFEL